MAWHVEAEPESEAAVAGICDRLFSFWDPVQRRILEDLFAAYRRLPPAASVELDAQSGMFIDTDRNLSLNVGVQPEVQTDAGREVVRIKTGGSGTSRVEAAAYYADDDETTLVDVMLAHDDRVDVTRPTAEEAQQALSDVFDPSCCSRVRRPPSSSFRVALLFLSPSCTLRAVPGPWGDVSYRTRTLRVSKTHLANLAHCHRSAGGAWKVSPQSPNCAPVIEQLDDPQAESVIAIVGQVPVDPGAMPRFVVHRRIELTRLAVAEQV